MSRYSEKLKKGDKVVMHTCGEAESNIGQIWTCKTDQFTRGTGVYEQDSVFLEGYSGSFAPEFLQKVILPSEDKRVLAALEEAQQRIGKLELYVKALEFSRDSAQEMADRIAKEKGLELYEAQQTVTLKQSIIEILVGQVTDETSLHAKTAVALIMAEQTIARQREALTLIADMKVVGSSYVCMQAIARGELIRERQEGDARA